MSESKPSFRDARRKQVLDAAERLMNAKGSAAFSMRELAEAAEVSFATPFNQFNSRSGIMQALSARRIDEMTARFSALSPPPNIVSRVLAAVDIAVGVLLEAPAVNRAVIGSLGEPGAVPGRVAAHSRELWAAALGGGAGLNENLRKLAITHLPEQMALGFRGCLSFWVAGEIPDAALSRKAQTMAATLLLGFATDNHRLVELIELA